MRRHLQAMEGPVVLGDGKEPERHGELAVSG